MARLYADEDFDYRVVEELRRHGHDVLAVHETGQASQGISDVQVLAFAVADARGVITHNRRHFIRLHRHGGPHAGIIVCTRDGDVVALASRINQALASYASLDNQLIRVVRPPTA